MDETMMNRIKSDISIQELFFALWQKKILITVVSVFSAVVFFVGSLLLITPQYEAAAKFYVNNTVSLANSALSISSGDLTTSRKLVESYIVILETRESIDAVIAYSGVDRTYGEVKEMFTAKAVRETEIFEVTVTSEDPREAEKLANAIAYILPKRISTIIEGTSAKVVEAAVIPAKASSPNLFNNSLIGFLLGFIASVGLITLRRITDTTIQMEEDIAQCGNYPILTSVPNMNARSKGSTYYGYGDNKSATAGNMSQKANRLIGKDISFAASEAYKLLRTKIQFSFADEEQCRVIGMSSALSGEGKSLSSVNLAYSLAELGKKVVLVDCDMRRPTIAEKMGLQKKPGLSSYLTGQASLKSLIQAHGDGGSAFHVIAAGQTPPNPAELLSSNRMKAAMESMRGVYDYVILDLPPIMEVSDALITVQYMDGMLLVVRQNYCDTISLSEAIRQFEFVDTKLIGLVFNCVEDGGTNGYYKKYGRYGRYGRYGKYSGRYYGRYHGRYHGRYSGRYYEINRTGNKDTSANLD